MDIVSSTQNSKFPKRNPSQILSDSEKGLDNAIPATEFLSGNGSNDHIDLSKRTKEALQSIEQEVQKLIKEYPMYASMFFSNETKGLMQELETLSSLLKQPSYQQMIDRDPKFMEFYTQVIGLGEIYQANLHRYQNDLRSSKPLTYSKPNGLDQSS